MPRGLKQFGWYSRHGDGGRFSRRSFGHALGEAGCVKATYGTGSSVMAPVNSAQCDIATLAQPLPGMMAKILFTVWKEISPTPAVRGMDG